MKEARIDAILQSIATTLLVYLPKTAVDPNSFYEENLIRRDEIGKAYCKGQKGIKSLLLNVNIYH